MAVRLLFLLLLLACSTARADRYTLRAELDDRAHIVRGTERLTFTNASSAAVDHLVFHLYMNAFESAHTVFMRESGGELRGVKSESLGSIRVTSMRLGGADLLAGAERELVPGDRTQMRVRLPHRVPPGESITLDIAFVTRLPKVAARSGYVGDFHCVAQWFPKLAKLEPNGRFASFPYHGHGEFYADFATYDLTVVTAPGLVVGSSGHLVREGTQRDGRVERRYFADRVHDVTFVTSETMHVAERTCARVNVHLMYPPGYRAAAETQMSAVCRALAFLGETYGAYGYVDLTVVLPPRGADGAAGMEYPTLFLSAGPWFDTELVGIDEPTEVTIHELVHQWFQGMVASNEVEHAFLDEGITSFVTSDYHVSYAPRAADLRAESMRRFTNPRPAPAPAAHVRAFRRHYGSVVYGRTEMILETVARTWGRDRIRAALGRYARENRFRHPVPSDLFAAFDATYYPGFSRGVLEPLLVRNVETRARVFARDGGLVAERIGPSAIPVDVLYEAADGRRTLTRFGDGTTRRFGRGCVTIDPYRKNMLDRNRTDDRVCTRESRERPTYVARLAAALAAFVGGVP